MTTFCIITCTYNAEKELPRTLESVGGQSYGSVCHIIIDGASSDKTVALASAYADNNHSSHTVKVVSEKDNGLYDAMNKGIRLSEGDYILFLNAGDTFADRYTLERIATQISNIGGRELPAVIYGKTDIVDNDGNFLRHRRLQPPETLTLKSFLNCMLVCHQAFYARRDLAQDTPYDLSYRLSADVDWCIRIMKEAGKKGLALHNTHLTLCRYLEGGMSVKSHRASLIERFLIMKKHYGLFRTLLVHLWFIIRK